LYYDIFPFNDDVTIPVGVVNGIPENVAIPSLLTKIKNLSN
jgi:hypothetical protein